MNGIKQVQHRRAIMFVEKLRRKDGYVLLAGNGCQVDASRSKHGLKKQAIGFNLYISHRERIGKQLVNRGVTHLDM